jgi:hypothetical protein
MRLCYVFLSATRGPHQYAADLANHGARSGALLPSRVGVLV